MNYFTDVLKKYAVFSGRAGRKEYWMFGLFTSIIAYALYLLDIIIFGTKGIQLFYYIYCLATFIPAIAVMTRRLHDTNHSAWWYFIMLIPIVGAIWFLVLLIKDSNAIDNKYGSVPQKTSFNSLQRIGVFVLIIILIILFCFVGYFNIKASAYKFSALNQPINEFAKPSLASCVKIQNSNDKTTCIISAVQAIKNPDINICDAFNDGSQCVAESTDFKPISITCNQLCLDWVYDNKAGALKDASFCGQMTADSAKDGCYVTVASETNNYSLCANEGSDISKDTCYSNIAQAIKDPSACGQVTNSSEELLCYANIALAKNDFSVCANVVEPKNDNGNPLRNQCLDYFLAKTQVSMAKTPGDIDSVKLPADLLKKVCPLYIPTVLGEYGGQSDCIKAFSPAPTLSVIAPNSGTFGKNDQITVKWTTNLPNNTVNIQLQSQDTKLFCHVTYVNNTSAGSGSYNFVPANTTCGNVPGNYRMSLSVEDIGGLTKDALGGWFTIR